MSFGSPAVDMCLKCIQYDNKIHSGDRSCIADQTLQKKRSGAFYSLLQAKNDGVTISFDCQRNMVLPNISD